MQHHSFETRPLRSNTDGNPIGGLVFAGGRQIHEWDSFISDTQFCFRACTGNSNSLAAEWCEHVYDEMGCDWNMPSLTGYNKGFTVCEGESGSLPGKHEHLRQINHNYNPSTFSLQTQPL